MRQDVELPHTHTPGAQQERKRGSGLANRAKRHKMSDLGIIKQWGTHEIKPLRRMLVDPQTDVSWSPIANDIPNTAQIVSGVKHITGGGSTLWRAFDTEHTSKND